MRLEPLGVRHQCWLCVSMGLCWLHLVYAQVNVTLQSTNPDIIYNPPACDGTTASVSCSNSSWRIIPSSDGPDSVVTSTNGPKIGGFIPQLFMTFTGLALYIRTSSLSNATANITLFTEDPVISITTEVDSAVGLIVAVDLQPDKATTLAITFVPSSNATRLDISSFTITIPTNDTSPFPSTTLPISSSLPTFSPLPSPTPTTGSNRVSQSTGDIVAEVLGAVLGVVLGASGAFAFRYYRRRRRQEAETLSAQG